MITRPIRKVQSWLRALYDWTLQWAETPNAGLALFILALAESSFFPIPPDALLIALVIAAPSRFFRYAFLCSIGSVIGGVLGYYIGWGLMESIGWPIIRFYHVEPLWREFQSQYRQYGLIFLAAAAFTPIPYKVATIASGATGIDFWAFITISSLGRAGRFFLVAGLLRVLGPWVKELIEKYFDILSILFVVLLFAGFMAIRYLF